MVPDYYCSDRTLQLVDAGPVYSVRNCTGAVFVQDVLADERIHFRTDADFERRTHR
jgi:hypothetical protein